MLFARRAQDSYVVEGELSENTLIRPAVFLGTFITEANGSLGPIECPSRMASTPGHYNVIALLPEDNTFAKGSLYVLKPGTKCVVMDVDGTLTVRHLLTHSQLFFN